MKSRKFHLPGMRELTSLTVAIIATAIFLFLRPSPSFAETLTADEYAGGTGTTSDPYQIANLAQLRRLSEREAYDWDGNVHFVVTADIDASETSSWNGGEGFSPIGGGIRHFRGSFDGGGHVISGLTINRPTQSEIGLFGYPAYASIKNITLDNIAITGGNNTGGLIGSDVSSVVENVSVSGSVQSDGTAGGLIGHGGWTVTNCDASVSTTGGDIVGGLVGSVGVGTISNCTASGTVTGNIGTGGWNGEIGVGGLIGVVDWGANISNCSASGDVTGGDNTGGLIGTVRSLSTVNQCTSSGSIVGKDRVGGLIGQSMDVSITDSSSTSNVEGQTSVGGIAGKADWDTSITDSTYSGSVTGVNYTGGLAGDSERAVFTESSASGSVEGEYGSGGLVGYSLSTDIRQCTSSANVVGQQDTGGLIGHSDDSNIIECSASGAVEGESDTGGLIGAASSSTISFSMATGGVAGVSVSGGLIGRTRDSYGLDRNTVVEQSEASGDTTGGSSTAGLIGYMADFTVVSACQASGTITGSSSTGGLIGSVSDGSITDCSASGNVKGGGASGGLIGSASGGTVSRCFSSGSVNGDGGSCGGLIGSSSAAVSYCTSSGNVTGDWYVGGLVGSAWGPIATSTASGNVTGIGSIGGLVGELSGAKDVARITNTIAYGNVAGERYIGGLLGRMTGGMVASSQAEGSVNASATSLLTDIGMVVGSIGYDNGYTPENNILQCVRGSGSVSGYYEYEAIKSVFDEEQNKWIYLTDTVQFHYPAVLVGIWKTQYDEGKYSPYYEYDSEKAAALLDNRCFDFEDPEQEGVTVEVTVYDSQTGAGLDSVSVQFGGITQTTDSNGQTTFTDLSPSTYTVEISTPGYTSVSAKESLWTKKKTINLSYELTPNIEMPGDSPWVIDVTSKYSDSSKEAFFLDGTSFPVTFEAVVNWNGNTPDTIEFKTPRGAPHATTDGKITLNMGTDFGPGGRLVVTAIAEDGSRSNARDANIEVMEEVFPYTPLLVQKEGSAFKYYSSDVEFGSPQAAESFQVPDKYPLINGNKVEFVPLVKVGMEMNDNLVTYRATKEVKEIEGGVDLFGYRPGLKENFTIGGEFYRKYLASENDWFSSGGGLTIAAAISGSRKFGPWPWTVGPVPLYGRAEIGGGVNGSCLVGWEVDNWLFSGEFGANVKGSGTLGVGLNKLVNVEATLSLTTTAQYTYSLENAVDYHIYAGLTGEVSSTLLYFSSSAELGKCTWKPLSDSGTTLNCDWGDAFAGDSTASLLADVAAGQISATGQADTRDWQPLPRDYGAEGDAETTAFSTLSDTSAANAATDYIPGQQNIYPFSEPNLIASSNGTKLVWITDDTTKNSNNRTSILYSAYQGGNWTTPIKILENGTADFTPVLGELTSTALLVWQDSKTVFGEEDITLEQLLASQEIAVSLYDQQTQQWGPVTRLTDDDSLDRTPVLATSGENALVVWVSNAATEIVGSGDALNTIRYAFYNGTNWLTGDVIAGLGAVIGLDVLYDAQLDSGVLIYALDSDDDLSTSYDQELYRVNFSGASWDPPTRLTSDYFQDTNPRLYTSDDGSIYLFWKRGYSIMQAVDFDMQNPATAVAGETVSDFGDFELVRDGGQPAFLWSEVTAEGQNLFIAAYDASAQVWGKPLQITSDIGLNRSYTGVFTQEGNALLAVYNHVNFDSTTTREIEIDGEMIEVEVPQKGATDLLSLQFPVATDVVIVSDAITVEPDFPMPHDTVELSVTVGNLGLLASESATVGFYYGDPQSGGALIGEQNVNLYPGYRENVTQSYSIPGVVDVNTPIYAVVSPGEGSADTDEANNTISTQIFFNDLSVDYLYSRKRGPSLRQIIAVVKNTGAGSCQDIPVVFKHENTIIHTETISSLEPHESYEVIYEWNVDEISADENGYHLVRAVANGDELIPEVTYANNSMQTAVHEYGLTVIDADSDFDGMGDDWEREHFGDLTHDGSFDSDYDGSSDLEEYKRGTDPFDDTDSDGMPDGWELKYGLDIGVNDRDADDDNDGVTNWEEFLNGTNPSIAPPPNDAFENAALISGGLLYAGSNIDATFEAAAGEPDHEGHGSHSVWWRWQASQSGLHVFSTRGTDFNTVLTVYEGDTLDNLVRVTGNDDIESGVTLASQVELNSTEGKTYFIAVDGFAGAQGEIQLLSYSRLTRLEQIISTLQFLTGEGVNANANIYNVDVDGNGKIELMDAIQLIGDW